MALFKNALSLLCLFLSVALTGQNKGSLEFNISGEDNYDYNNNQVRYSLVKNDSVYKTYADYKLITDWAIDSIAEGIYTLHIKIDSSDFATFYNIKVEAKKRNTYDFTLQYYKRNFYKSKPDTSSTTYQDKAEFTINTQYGNNTWHETIHKNFNEIYSGEMALNLYHAVSKHYTIGMKIGGQYANTLFYNDTSSFAGKHTLSKNYTSVIANAGIINRFTFYNNKLLGADGLKVDLGVVYNFPLFFKQIYTIDDNTKLKTRHIHKYTDVSAIVRIGYKYVGIQAEYNLFNFLKTGYTEIPSLRAGIVFYIPLLMN